MNDKPRFSIETDEIFHKKVKIKSAREDKPMNEIIIGLLKKWLKGEVEID